MRWLWQSIEFQQPWFLLFILLAVPVFWLVGRAGGRVVFSSFRLLPARAASWRARLAWLPSAALALAVAGMAIALAGPRVQEGESQIRREGISIMMVVDTSPSMLALDLSEGDRERTRLEAVKEVFIQFVNGDSDLSGRRDDSIGIVSFAAYADTRCPLTLNHGSLTQIAADLEIVSDPTENRTALGDGLALALERLREAKTESRVAILLTDGVNNAGEVSPLSAADLAKTLGIKVYTIGAGTNGIAYARINDDLGRSFLEPMRVQIDEETLKAIAERTDGQYFRATDAEGLRAVYREIDRLERSEISEQKLAEYNEYYAHVLAIALILACVGWLLGATLFRRLPC
ncbi:MAG: VWA domain-containing protein [Proteobacteria bacterium]|nr:VWA domain-containing protein [Pseudomonadota bacterium]